MNRDERGEFGNPVGNGLMSCGCLLLLIPMIIALVVLFFMVLGSMFQGA